MIRDLRGHVRKIADFLNKPLDEATLNEITRRSSFDVMKENPNANFKAPFGDGLRLLRRGKPGIWKSRLTEAENEAMEKAFSRRMQEINIEFSFYSYNMPVTIDKKTATFACNSFQNMALFLRMFAV
ncbi:sulfotransferase 1C1-like [Ptychodera flava]|uniref:sulfotransferase 1C1-like n=1 Tax=Ptychodera flava TaxID=63121 RepID=UPI00396A77E8